MAVVQTSSEIKRAAGQALLAAAFDAGARG